MVQLLISYSLILVTVVRVTLSCELITVEDYENYAKQRLPFGALEYLQRGADKDFTVERNREAFSKIKVIPRYLLDVSNRTTDAEALGKQFKLPIGISPSGLLNDGMQMENLRRFVVSDSFDTIAQLRYCNLILRSCFPLYLEFSKS